MGRIAIIPNESGPGYYVGYPSDPEGQVWVATMQEAEEVLQEYIELRHGPYMEAFGEQDC